MVAPVLYRVVGFPQLGTFSARETHACVQCGGRGEKRGRSCDWCTGTGRLLGSSPLYWPRPVEVVEDAPVGEQLSIDVSSPTDTDTARTVHVPSAT